MQSGLEAKTSHAKNSHLIMPTAEKLQTNFDISSTAWNKVCCRSVSLQDCSSNRAPPSGCESCKANPDMWIERFAKPDRTLCHGFIFVSVCDAHCANHDATAALEAPQIFLKMKLGFVGDTDVCLKANLKQLEVVDTATNKICKVRGL